MSEEIAFNLRLSSRGPAGLGMSMVPFGAFKVRVKKSETKLVSSGKNKGMPGTTLWCEVLDGSDPEQAGKEIRPYIVWPTDEVEGDKLDAMTARCREWLMVSAEDEEKAEAALKTAGVIKGFSPDGRFEVGLEFHLINDPADPKKRKGKNEKYDNKRHESDEIRAISEDVYKDFLAGKQVYARRNTFGLNVPSPAEAAANSGGMQSGAAKKVDTGWSPGTGGAPVQQPTQQSQSQDEDAAAAIL